MGASIIPASVDQCMPHESLGSRQCTMTTCIAFFELVARSAILRHCRRFLDQLYIFSNTFTFIIAIYRISFALAVFLRGIHMMNAAPNFLPVTDHRDARQEYFDNSVDGQITHAKFIQKLHCKCHVPLQYFPYNESIILSTPTWKFYLDETRVEDLMHSHSAALFEAANYREALDFLGIL